MKVVSSEQVYEGKAVSLRKELIELPSGKRFTREIVVHSGASAIIPITSKGKVIFVRQYRHPISEYIFEIPAGTLRPGEDPEVCARRELEEETGYVADELLHLLTIYPCPGYSSERLYVYLARGLRRGAQSLEMDEDLSVVELGLEEALESIRRGEIKDAKTIAAILYYYNFVVKCW